MRTSIFHLLCDTSTIKLTRNKQLTTINILLTVNVVKNI